MISELKDDEILDFLMTTDFEEDYSPDEFKYLLVKWRYFYRLKSGLSDRMLVDLEGKLRELEEKIKLNELEKTELNNKLSNSQEIINGLKNRSLSFKERWSGKIIFKENEN